MGSIRTFNPVKLFVGVLIPEEARLADIEARLTAEYGPIDLRHETGDNSRRLFYGFERLIEADLLPGVKLWTNDLERDFARSQLDPGYLENSKVILASTRNSYHRIYLGRGIFGEVTMHFRQQEFEFFPWTDPDYQSEAYQKFFLELRRLYRAQLKTMCLLKRN